GGTPSGGAGGTAGRAGAGGAQTGGAGGQPSCASRYGMVPGYFACGETSTTCRFVQAQAMAQTCTAVCASRRGPGSAADNGDPGSCTVTMANVGCSASLASSICTCSR